MRFCVEGSVKQGRWEPDRFHQTKVLSLGCGFYGHFCWSWVKVWQTDAPRVWHSMLKQVPTHFPVRAPTPEDKEWTCSKQAQLSTQWRTLPHWTDVRQFPVPACWTWTQMAKDHIYNMGRHMYESAPNRKTTPQFPQGLKLTYSECA